MKSTAPHPRRRTLLVLIGLIAVAAIAWAVVRHVLDGERKAPPPAPVPVTLAAVERGDVDVYDIGVGSVTPNQSVTVHSRVDGQLQKLGYTEGKDVQAGQLIAQLDPRPFQAQLAQATAQEARDAAQLANARRDLARYQDLIKDQGTSQQTLDTQKALVAQLSATVQTDDAQVRYAKTQLDYTTITAPIAGRTGLRLVDVGNIVHAADTTGLVVIDQIDPITVVFTLPDNTFSRVNAAMRGGSQPLKVVAYAHGDARPLATGTLVLIDNHIATANGTFQLKATFANADHALWPGQYVDIHVFTAHRPQALSVPEAAIQRGPKGTYVYAVDADHRAQIRPVEVALIQDGRAIVASGLDAGQQVATDGQYKLKPGVVTSAVSSPKVAAS